MSISPIDNLAYKSPFYGPSNAETAKNENTNPTTIKLKVIKRLRNALHCEPGRNIFLCLDDFNKDVKQALTLVNLKDVVQERHALQSIDCVIQLNAVEFS